MAALDDLLRAIDGARMATKQPRHLLWRLEMAFGIGETAEAQLVDGAAQPYGGQHVVQRPPLGHVVVDIVGCDQGAPASAARSSSCARRRASSPRNSIVPQDSSVAEQAGERAQPLAEGGLVGPARRQDDGQEAVGMRRGRRR